MNKEESKTLLYFDNICIITYLIIGFIMLYYADSIGKFLISGFVLLLGALMIHIVYFKKKCLINKKVINND